MKGSGLVYPLRQSLSCFIRHHPALPTSRMSRIRSQHVSTSKLCTALIFKNQAGPQFADKNYTRTPAKLLKSKQGCISVAPGASSLSTSRDSHCPDTISLLSSLENTAQRQRTRGNKFARTPLVLQSFAGIWSAAIVCGIISSAVIYICYPAERGSRQDLEQTSRNFSNQLNVPPSGNWNTMTGDAPPGRPGTLTVEQEEKLKEFWVATLKVFGVLDEQEAKAVIENGTARDAPARSDTASTKDKKSRKRKSLFSRKRKGDDDKSSISTDSSAQAIVDTEDKYGQTKEFHDALASMSPGVLRSTFWDMVKHDHPDALLLRFLRARKWDVERALVMMVSTMRWRATQMYVDEDIMKNGEGGALEDEASSDVSKKSLGRGFLSQMRMGKSFLHGTDNAGRPMCFVRARLHKQGEQSEESLERYTVFLIESARMILNPPVDTACIMFDMTGFGLANMDYTPVKFMIKCFEANYPESLGVILIHKAPWVFQGIWKIIKGWLDPVVAAKVNFTNTVEDLEEYVPKSQIIKELGGLEDWSYEYMEPIVGENIKMADTETRDKLLAERAKMYKEYEMATLEWIRVNAEEIKGKRNEIAGRLKEDYWVLDPYLRARSFYDRCGMLSLGGGVQFYPVTVNGNGSVETEKPVNLIENPIQTETSTDDVD